MTDENLGMVKRSISAEGGESGRIGKRGNRLQSASAPSRVSKGKLAAKGHPGPRLKVEFENAETNGDIEDSLRSFAIEEK